MNAKDSSFSGRNLNTLLRNDKEAKEFFLSLPDYVQGSLTQHTFQIRDEQDLKQFADFYYNQY